MSFHLGSCGAQRPTMGRRREATPCRSLNPLRSRSQNRTARGNTLVGWHGRSGNMRSPVSARSLRRRTWHLLIAPVFSTSSVWPLARSAGRNDNANTHLRVHTRLACTPTCKACSAQCRATLIRGSADRVAEASPEEGRSRRPAIPLVLRPLLPALHRECWARTESLRVRHPVGCEQPNEACRQGATC